MKQWKTIALALGCATLFSSFTAKHEYYVSVGEMSLNPTTNQLEIGLRIFTDDLEYALERAGHPGLDVLNDETSAEHVSEYVLDHFRIWNEDGREIKLFYLGLEGDADGVFVYLETKVKSGLPEEVQVRHAILMESFPDQINILHYSHPDIPTSLRFDAEEPTQTLELQDL
ncbi:DUF6702 family protein [Phaeocystidibacter luteus]|uniref:Uncharacterized protein n=1 Tax=Phaeocystidibacter luteus TaxID=911197 RepID=A0A6N6RG95_9FLAO|nr:DUF6702 family protein [Phaeocystidibacter luteus]KAB2808082.1 hypothetical protein F8C67_10965 [Phaeocystidibacter luteus]